VKDKSMVTGRSEVGNYEEGIAKLKNKEADTFFAEAVLLPLDPAVAFREKPLTVEPYALVMRKGDPEFVATINRLMAKVIATQSEAMVKQTGLAGKVNALTRDAWRRP